MKKRGRKVNIDADLDGEVENYQPSDSDDGFDENDRELLNNAVGRKTKEGEEEVLKVYSSSEDSESDDVEEEEGEDGNDDDEDDALYQGGVGSDMDSDIEGKGEDDDLPDSKAWGSDRKQYYDTDYVDKDFLDFDDEEAAEQEEKEATAIHQRLLAHLEGTDYTLGLLDLTEERKIEESKKREESELWEDEEKVEVDLSKLSREEQIELIKRKVPGIITLLNDCKDRLKYLRDKVYPVLKLVDAGTIKGSNRIIHFLEMMRTLCLHLSLNTLYFLGSIEKDSKISNHAVIKKIKSLNLLLREMDTLRNHVDKNIDTLLALVEKGDDIKYLFNESTEVEAIPKNRKERRKRKLDLLKKKEKCDALVEAKKRKLMELEELNFEEELESRANIGKKVVDNVVYSEEESEDEDEDGNAHEEVEGDKRGVTFEMMKNKGLTPRRKKENRNPRVKHRKKFKKALVRRKGQVRAPRNEITKYGGETSGINANVRKSIKIK